MDLFSQKYILVPSKKKKNNKDENTAKCRETKKAGKARLLKSTILCSLYFFCNFNNET